MALINSKRAWIFDERGEYHGSKGFGKNDKTFKYGKGSYNIDFENSSYKEDVPIPMLWKRRTYFYNLSNSNPIKLNKKSEPPISPELYNINLETKVARDLNDLSKKGFFSFLSPKIIILIVIAGVVIYYLVSTGKLG